MDTGYMGITIIATRPGSPLDKAMGPLPEIDQLTYEPDDPADWVQPGGN